MDRDPASAGTRGSVVIVCAIITFFTASLNFTIVTHCDLAANTPIIIQVVAIVALLGVDKT